jgi:hypothetical protein
MENKFELILFYSNVMFTSTSVKAGVDKVIIDWENKGKELRQKLFDTQINKHSYKDLENVKSEINVPVITRINEFSNLNKDELERTINLGTNEILLPMVKEPKEVETILKQINGRTKLGILIETNSAINNAKELSKFPLSRVYVGLNDLSIERNNSNIFIPLYDGTIDEVRQYFNIPFGFGGLTHPNLGTPIPCLCLMEEMVRLKCDFSFLRRSFMKDSKNNPELTISNIRNTFKSLYNRSSIEILNDKRKFIDFFKNEILSV